jgi:hypothetical protein
MINEKQCTVLWHINNIKVSHVDLDVGTRVLNLFDGKYGKEARLTMTRGKIREYLGITLDFRTKGKVIITMVNYIKTLLKELPP